MERTFNDIPREEIAWFPTISYQLCNNCDVCIKFCPNGVFIRESNNKIIVQNPYNCTVGCNQCELICPNKAIKFPSLDVIREAKQKWGAK